MANPPPPYDNITGISRAVMKDNAQETLANYNGNARPGELVVDLTQDPPPLYVGNNAGQLTLVTSGGGGAGLPLANGTSNFNIATSGGNATVTIAGTHTWTFDTTGNVTVPGQILTASNSKLDFVSLGANTAYLTTTADDSTALFMGVFGVELRANDYISITTNTDDTSYLWTFGADSTLTNPGPIQMAVYANTTVRDAAITSPQPGMMIYVTGTGMQVRGTTQWNTIAGSGT